LPRILGIDPGSDCGYCWVDVAANAASVAKVSRSQAGIWNLHNNRFEGGGMRLLRLRKFLEEVNPDLVVYEEVQFRQKSGDASRVYNQIVGCIQMYCEEHGVQYSTVRTGDIKKRATGKGSGKKPPVIDAANVFFDIQPLLNNSEAQSNHDDDIADAMWICQLAMEMYGPYLKTKDKARLKQDLLISLENVSAFKQPEPEEGEEQQ